MPALPHVTAHNYMIVCSSSAEVRSDHRSSSPRSTPRSSDLVPSERPPRSPHGAAGSVGRQLPGVRDGVRSAAPPGATTQQPGGGEPRPPHRTVDGDRLYGELRAARLKPAAPRELGADPLLVDADRGNQPPLGAPGPRPATTVFRHRTPKRSAGEAPAALGPQRHRHRPRRLTDHAHRTIAPPGRNTNDRTDPRSVHRSTAAARHRGLRQHRHHPAPGPGRR